MTNLPELDYDTHYKIAIIPIKDYLVGYRPVTKEDEELLRFRKEPFSLIGISRKDVAADSDTFQVFQQNIGVGDITGWYSEHLANTGIGGHTDPWKSELGELLVDPNDSYLAWFIKV